MGGGGGARARASPQRTAPALTRAVQRPSCVAIFLIARAALSAVAAENPRRRTSTSGAPTATLAK